MALKDPVPVSGRLVYKMPYGATVGEALRDIYENAFADLGAFQGFDGDNVSYNIMAANPLIMSSEFTIKMDRGADTNDVEYFTGNFYDCAAYLINQTSRGGTILPENLFGVFNEGIQHLGRYGDWWIDYLQTLELEVYQDRCINVANHGSTTIPTTAVFEQNFVYRFIGSGPTTIDLTLAVQTPRGSRVIVHNHSAVPITINGGRFTSVNQVDSVETSDKYFEIVSGRQGDATYTNFNVISLV